MDVVVWLQSLGLGKHEAAFRENDLLDTLHDAAALFMARWADRDAE
jgi:hypothetical protein